MTERNEINLNKPTTRVLRTKVTGWCEVTKLIKVPNQNSDKAGTSHYPVTYYLNLLINATAVLIMTYRV